MENIEEMDVAELERRTAPTPPEPDEDLDEPEPVVKTRKGNTRNGDTDKRPNDVKADKPKRVFLPFDAVIYSKPDRDVVTERKNRKTGAIIPGNTSTLMAEIIIPMLGGVANLRGTIWKEEKFDRKSGQFQLTYSVGLLNRYDFLIVDGHKRTWDAWRENVLDGFDKWRKSDAYKVIPTTDKSMAPRLVETRAPTAEELVILSKV